MYMISLLLGLGAWVISLASIFRKKSRAGWSFGLCAASLYLQILQTHILVNKPDWAAIEDTYRAVLISATVLISVTVLLNIIAAFVRRSRNP